MQIIERSVFGQRNVVTLHSYKMNIHDFPRDDKKLACKNIKILEDLFSSIVNGHNEVVIGDDMTLFLHKYDTQVCVIHDKFSLAIVFINSAYGGFFRIELYGDYIISFIEGETDKDSLRITVREDK